MSGGAYDYRFEDLKNTYVGKMHDIELDKLMKDLAGVLKALEWWQSGDTEQETYRKVVKTFKEKWLGVSQEERVTRLIKDALGEAEDILREALLFELENEDFY